MAKRILDVLSCERAASLIRTTTLTITTPTHPCSSKPTCPPLPRPQRLHRNLSLCQLQVHSRHKRAASRHYRMTPSAANGGVSPVVRKNPALTQSSLFLQVVPWRCRRNLRTIQIRSRGETGVRSSRHGKDSLYKNDLLTSREAILGLQLAKRLCCQSCCRPDFRKLIHAVFSIYGRFR